MGGESMRNRQTTFAYIIFGLIGIGILSALFSNPAGMLIPVLVFGVIFYLYKYPPKSWRGFGRSSTRFTKPPKRKNATFRVINGNRRDDSEEPPKYH
jgi:hypothetical protein